MSNTTTPKHCHHYYDKKGHPAKLQHDHPHYVARHLTPELTDLPIYWDHEGTDCDDAVQERTMSNTTTLRDPNQPCEHYSGYPHREDPMLDMGAIEGGAVLVHGNWTCNVPGCPGGRERTLEKRFLPNGQWFYATELEGEPSMAVPVLDVEFPDGQ